MPDNNAEEVVGRAPDVRLANHAAQRAPNRAALYREAIGAAALGLLVNLALGVTKLVGGWLGNSFALISDAVNSFGDVLASCVVVFALRVAQRPASAEHPYGYMRAEAIAASNVALLVILSAVGIAFESVRHVRVTHGLPPSWTLWIAAGNVLIKEALYQYKVRVGRRTGSSALIANAWDHRGDALCSAAVVMGLGLVRWGGPSWIWADEAAAMVVAAAILGTGIALFLKCARELMDAQADNPFVDVIRRTAAQVAGVAAIEKLWVRKSGLEYFVDIHLQVDSQMTVADGHRIGHHVKDRLMSEFSVLRDVLVHLEPHRPAPPPQE